MIEAAEGIVEDGSENNVAKLKHFCPKMREDLGDAPDTHEYIEFVQGNLKNHVEFGDPKVFGTMMDSLPDMIGILREIEFRRRVEESIYKHGVDAQRVFSVSFSEEGGTHSVRDLSVGTALTNADQESIMDLANGKELSDTHAYTLNRNDDGLISMTQTFELPVVSTGTA